MRRMASRGAFIVFEGVDRSGKTTQSKKLCEFLASKKISCAHMRFPDRTTRIGKLIDAYLTNKVDTDDHAIHLLFSANRWEQSKIIREKLENGETLVVDRYSYSGVAFTSSKDIDTAWCYAPERGLPAPDVVIYLSLPIEEALKRGDFGAERYEKKDMQVKVSNIFDSLKTEKWITLDARESPEEIAKKIEKVALTTIENVRESPIHMLI